MKKINILDTNVFLHDPQALNKFPKELIVIPISVIEEIDKFKRDQTELGRNARWTIKQIDALRASHPTGTISSATSELKPATYGIELANGGRLVIELNHIGTIKDLDPSIMDNRILSVAKYYNTLFMGKDDIEVFMYSKDANLRVKSDAYQVKSINYDSDQDILTDDFYTGYAEINVNSSVLTSFRESGELSISRIDAKLYANQYVILKSDDKQFELGCFDKKMESIVKLNDLNAMWGITPKNIEQQFAIDALLNPNIPLVTLSGPAGTGKTLLSVAAGLLQALDSGKYNKLLISRPIQPMGKDIGFLPGDMNEKMNPWMQPIFDNLEYIMNAGKGQNVKRNSKPHEELIAQGMLQVEPLTFIRGRSIPNQFFIIDESQNLTKHEIKTILSRAGIGTKIILTGDPDQIDNPYVDKTSNGLSMVIETLKDDELYAHVHLVKGERSPLADMIVKKMK